MLRVLAYIWAMFGAYWVMFAPAISAPAVSSVPRYLQKSRLAFLAITFALLLWKAHAIPPIWLIVVGLAWSGVALYWVAPKKTTHSGEYPFYRVLRLLIGAIAFSLLFWDKTAIGVLGTRFVPQRSAILGTGFITALVGLGIAAWARVHLGRYWSDKVVIQAGHRLVRSGPYAQVRHPIYSGVLLGIAGTALVVGEWRALASLLLMSVNYTVKAKREDQILAERFAEEFRSYQRNTGMLLPRI